MRNFERRRFEEKMKRLKQAYEKLPLSVSPGAIINYIRNKMSKNQL
ncbi:MAG TPA: hypothetical protein VFK44_07150 [Bacillales bacterium]|nr:hypothetical protein [Bacillales bacterium]